VAHSGLSGTPSFSYGVDNGRGIDGSNAKSPGRSVPQSMADTPGISFGEQLDIIGPKRDVGKYS
jgi:hypothetical protein